MNQFVVSISMRRKGIMGYTHYWYRQIALKKE